MDLVCLKKCGKSVTIVTIVTLFWKIVTLLKSVTIVTIVTLSRTIVTLLKSVTIVTIVTFVILLTLFTFLKSVKWLTFVAVSPEPFSAKM